MKKSNPLNFYLGIVAPLGVDREIFFSALVSCVKNYNLNISTEIEDKEKILSCKISEIVEIDDKQTHTNKSFELYAKMQIFNALRKSQHRCKFGKKILAMINTTKDKLSELKSENHLIVIDQIKNTFEYQLLSYVYGDNYTQIGLFSKPHKRNSYLESKFGEASDDDSNKESLLKILKKSTTIDLDCKKPLGEYIDNDIIDGIVNDYLSEIRNDCSSKLIKKDSIETDESHKVTGQSVSKLYHRSHFYFDLDKTTSELMQQVNTFIEILLGKNKEYPSQSEFAMAIAAQASVRSNFPHRRHIGATLVSKHGEVLSIGSIRAPSESPNTQLKDQDKILSGYQKYKADTEQWVKFLRSIEDNFLSTNNISKCEIFNTVNKKCKISKDSIIQLRRFISDSLDYHPCTHAEISAILDAAKLGVSIRGATLYTTLYPCHLCAKDLISAGIKKAVYLEAYPKSKNDQLYPHSITDHEGHDDEKINFSPFFGVGPDRFYFYYSLDNKPEDCEQIEKWRLRYSNSASIQARENEVIHYVKEGKSQNLALVSLLSHEDKSNK